MRYHTRATLEIEKLKWDSFIPEKADKLIIGTFPTVKHRRSFEFFYPNKNNPFWKILSKISDIPLVSADREGAISNRKRILENLNLGITDMGYKILRRGNSSSDQSIFPIVYMDILKIIDKNPLINKLILTSSSGKNSVEGWLRSYFKSNDVDFLKLKGCNPKRGFIHHNQKEIEIVVVHSTSKAAGRKLSELISMYRKEIMNI